MKQQLSTAGIPAPANQRTPDAMPSEKTLFQNPPAPDLVPAQHDEDSPEYLEDEKSFREFILSRLPKHKASQGLLQKLRLTINHVK